MVPEPLPGRCAAKAPANFSSSIIIGNKRNSRRDEVRHSDTVEYGPIKTRRHGDRRSKQILGGNVDDEDIGSRRPRFLPFLAYIFPAGRSSTRRFRTPPKQIRHGESDLGVSIARPQFHGPAGKVLAPRKKPLYRHPCVDKRRDSPRAVLKLHFFRRRNGSRQRADQHEDIANDGSMPVAHEALASAGTFSSKRESEQFGRNRPPMLLGRFRRASLSSAATFSAHVAGVGIPQVSWRAPGRIRMAR